MSQDSGEDPCHLLEQNYVRIPAQELRDDALPEAGTSVSGRADKGREGRQPPDWQATDLRYLQRRTEPSTP